VLYAFLYNIVFQKEIFDLGFIAFTPHIAAFFTQFPITFASGFWLNRYVSFSESTLKGRTQIIRYLSIVICCITINYIGLKFFVEVCHIYPTPSQMINTLITTIFSYFAQKHFSFKAWFWNKN
jgi:putative flippase GtrA